MKKVMIVVCILFLAAGLAYGKDYEISKKAGDMTVQVGIDKNPPVTGNNKLTIGIKDAGGREITDAALAVHYGMAAMPGMPAMNYNAPAALKDKAYVSNLNFSMSGPWFINIKITRGGKAQTVKLNVDVK